MSCSFRVDAAKSKGRSEMERPIARRASSRPSGLPGWNEIPVFDRESTQSKRGWPLLTILIGRLWANDWAMVIR